MLITITTDASFHLKHKVGAYAFWISCSKGRFKYAGVLKEPCTSPTEAEYKCIINAMHTLSKYKFEGIKKVIINTDSLNVIHLYNKKKAEIKRYRLGNYQILNGTFHNLLDKINLKGRIEFRHVKAHKSTDTAREFVNEWCDTEAKKHLWNKINKDLVV